MEDNTEVVESTEVKPERESAELSIRQTLSKQFRGTEQEDSAKEPVQESKDEDTEAVPVSEETASGERAVFAPPADMNKAEKEAFLNPTAENAHVLQSYLNRRAYETRTQYDRKAQELNQLIERNSNVYNTIKQYEEEYAKEGISIQDVARRSVAWDRAMKANPYETAVEWLQAYGISPQDLVDNNQNQTESQQPQQEYLTREEAERIAEERWTAMQQEQEKKAVEYMNQRTVESFMNQKPLFRDPETASQLEAEMAPVVQALTQTGRYSSPEEILETAYNYVVNGNPVFSGLMQKLQAKPVIQQQMQVVQKAKQAAKSISGSAGSGTPRVVTKDIRDNLRRRLGGD
jgi:hypothetical protein